MRPRISKLRQDDTHRLIPSKYLDHDESVLTRLTDDNKDLKALFELEGATNDRLLGEAGLLPGIGVRELVFGVPNFHVINAAFTHASPLGGRFNGSDRGAWYAGFKRETSEIEVALGEQLLEDGSAGVVYPSVRHKGGTCLVSFRPALVSNVRKDASVSIVFEDAFAEPEIRRTK